MDVKKKATFFGFGLGKSDDRGRYTPNRDDYLQKGEVMAYSCIGNYICAEVKETGGKGKTCEVCLFSD